MSFFGNFIGGAAEAGAGLINSNIAQEQKKSLADYNAQLDIQKSRAIEAMRLENLPQQLKMQADAADLPRQAQVARIAEEKKRIAAGAVGARYADPVLGDTPLSPDQQSVMDQGMDQQGREKTALTERIMADPQVSNQAAINTGDISPRDAMGDATKGDIAYLKAEVANAKTEADRVAKQAKLDQAVLALQLGGKAPPGYRFLPNGNMEAIPGGPSDLKLQGALNQDTAQLTGSLSGFDRLATAANEVLKHPGLPGITGWRGVIPNVPGSSAADAQALLATLKSQVGFGVLQDMRNNSKTGGALGAVSDAEGKRLEANLAALEKSQSLDQFKENLQKIIDYSEQAKDRVRDSFNLKHGDRRASGAGSAKSAPIPPAPDVGAVVDGYSYKGGNPADPNSWVKQ